MDEPAEKPGKVPMRLRGIGECILEIGDTVLGPESAVLFAIGVFLARHAGEELPRERLLELFWPGADEESARHRLRQTIYRLRRMGARVIGEGDSVTLDPASVEADQARQYVTAELLYSPTNEQVLGPFLPGYVPTVSSAFAAWLDVEREKVQSQLRSALHQSLVQARGRGRYDQVEAVSRRMLDLDPLNEEATLGLAEATALTGSKVEAVRMIDRYMAEIGPGVGDLRVQPSILRRRISERFEAPRRTASSPPFVGRKELLDGLMSRFNLTRRGQARAMLLHGEPGIGKTRTCDEFARIAVLQGARVVRASARPGDDLLPLSVFLQLVPRLLELPGSIGCSEEDLHCLRHLTQHQLEAAESFRESGSSDYRFARVRAAIYELVDCVTSEGAILLIVEDLHHVDAVSRELLQTLPARYPDRRLLILLSSRTPLVAGEVPVRGDAVVVEQQAVPSLSVEESEALYSALASQVEATEGALPERGRCVSRAAGNPLLLITLFNHPGDDATAATSPGLVHQLLRERIARLSPLARSVLQVCAILHDTCTLPLIEAMLDVNGHALLQALTELDLTGSIVSRDGQVRCRHDLIATEAIAELSPTARQLLHRRAAVALEASGGDSPTPALLWECTRHWLGSGDADHAIRSATRFALHLDVLGAHDDSVRLLTRTFGVATTAAHRAALLDALAQAYSRVGMWREVTCALDAKAVLRPAVALATTRHTVDEVLLLEARWRSDYADDTNMHAAMTCVVDDSAEPEHRLEMAALGLTIADNAVDHASAERLWQATNSIGVVGPRQKILKRTCDLIYHTSFGDLAKALEASDDAISLARDAQDTRRVARLTRWQSAPLRRLGALAAAENRIRESLTLEEKLGSAAGVIACLDFLSAVQLERDDPEQALGNALRLVALAAERDLTRFSDGGLYYAARSALVMGDVHGAETYLGELEGREPPFGIARSLVQFLAVRTHFHLAVRRAPPMADLKQLNELQRSLRTFGDQDYATAVLATAQRHAGEDEISRLTWGDYLTNFRRERGPVPQYVAGILELQA